MPIPDQEPFNSVAEELAELLRRQNEFDKRLARLESVVLSGARAPSKTSQAIPEGQVEQSPKEPPVPVLPTSTPVQQEALQPFQSRPVLETKVGLTIVNRVGVVTLVLGIAFFFKWAVDNNWIGPGGRVVLGVLAGLGTLAISDKLWHTGQKIFAQGLTGAGIAVLYLSVYAAFGFYHLILQWFAFLLLFLISGMALALSIRYGAQAITALGLFGGYLTPLLLSTADDHPWFLFGYLLLLNTLGIGLARKRNWRGLEIITFVATALIYGDWLLDRKPGSGERLVATLALFAYGSLFSQLTFRALFFSAQLLAALALALIWKKVPAAFFPLVLLLAAGGLRVSHLRRLPLGLSFAFASFWLSYAEWNVVSGTDLGISSRFVGITLAFLLFLAWQARYFFRNEQQITLQRLSVFALNGIVYYGAAYSLLNGSERAYLGLLAAAVAATYLLLALNMYRRRASGEQDMAPIVLSFGVGLCFLTLAIPLQFTGFTITLGWALQAAAVAWIGHRLRNNKAIIGSLVVFALTLSRVVAFDSRMYVNAEMHALVLNRRFLTFLVVGFCLLVAARWSQIFRQIALAEYFAGHFVLLFGLTLEVVDWASRSTAPQSLANIETVSVSVLFGIYAVGLIMLGVATRTALNRITGLILIGIVIIKLYLFDVWQLERVYRISAFVALGGLLIATSFVYSRFRRVVESWWKNDETASS